MCMFSYSVRVSYRQPWQLFGPTALGRRRGSPRSRAGSSPAKQGPARDACARLGTQLLRGTSEAAIRERGSQPWLSRRGTPAPT